MAKTPDEKIFLYWANDYFNSKNNYTQVNGLHLDMRPGIGSMDVKTILIDKNDNAEGTIMFDVQGGNFKGNVTISITLRLLRMLVLLLTDYIRQWILMNILVGSWFL